MKTVQECLREADRKELLNLLAYDELRSVMLLLECSDMTIMQIQTACRERMNDFIDHLLSLEAVPTDCKVLYMCDASPLEGEFDHVDKSLCMIDLDEIRKDIDASGYVFELTDWAKTLGYLVADTKLTRDYLIDLLAQYLNEISFFGTKPEVHDERINEVHAELDAAIEQAREGHTFPAKIVFEDLAKEHGFPIDERDDTQEDLEREVRRAELSYYRYCHRRERRRILESLGETVPEPVEYQMKKHPEED